MECSSSFAPHLGTNKGTEVQRIKHLPRAPEFPWMAFLLYSGSCFFFLNLAAFFFNCDFSTTFTCEEGEWRTHSTCKVCVSSHLRTLGSAPAGTAPSLPLCTEWLPRFKILRTEPSRENAQGLTQSCLFSRNKQHFFFFFLRKQLKDQKTKGNISVLEFPRQFLQHWAEVMR